MFTKAQMFERIKTVSEQQNENAKRVIKHINQLDDPEIQVLAEAVITAGMSVTDTLNNLTLILCETLPGASGRQVKPQDGSFVEGLRKATANDEKED